MQLVSSFAAGLLFLACNMLPAACSAQATQADVEARLVNKPLYLRGLWWGEKLEFDATGKPRRNYDQVSFTEAGIDVSDAELSGGDLHIHGKRVVLSFDRDHLAGVRHPMMAAAMPSRRVYPINILIRGSAGQDFGTALDAVFADSLGALAAVLPPLWQPYARRHFSPPPAPVGAPAAASSEAAASGAAGTSATSAPPRRARRADGDATAPPLGPNVQAPHLLKQAEPEFSEAARMAKIAGNVLISFVVNTDGLPENIRIVRPAGYGLDEKAEEAAKQYRFSPAMRDGVPMAVTINVDVNFQIF